MPFPLVAALPAIAAGIGGIASAVGQNSANQANRDMQRETNAFNAAEAQRNREFQERMSSTSWQRGLNDITAAGLNPALAYGQGGASSPSGAMGSGGTARVESTVGGAASTALRSVELKSQLESQSQQRLQSAAAVNESIERAKLTAAQSAQVRAYMGAGLSELQARAGSYEASAQRNRAEAGALPWLLPARVSALEAGRDRDRRSIGLMDAQESEIGSRILSGALTRELMRYSIPAARNAAGAADTWWGRRISPFLNDAQAAQRLISPYRLFDPLFSGGRP